MGGGNKGGGREEGREGGREGERGRASSSAFSLELAQTSAFSLELARIGGAGSLDPSFSRLELGICVWYLRHASPDTASAGP